MSYASVEEMKKVMEEKQKAREEFYQLREKTAPYRENSGGGELRKDAPDDIKQADKRQKYLWKKWLSWH